MRIGRKKQQSFFSLSRLSIPIIPKRNAGFFISVFVRVSLLREDLRRTQQPSGLVPPPHRRLVREHLAALAAMAAPTIALPPSDPSDALPELPQELLLTLLTKRAASDGPEKERDALDAFVLSGAANGGDGSGGVQVEDVLNELLPDGACPSPRPHRSQREVGRRTEPTLLSCAQKRVWHTRQWLDCCFASRSRRFARRSRRSRRYSSGIRIRGAWASCRSSLA